MNMIHGENSCYGLAGNAHEDNTSSTIDLSTKVSSCWKGINNRGDILAIAISSLIAIIPVSRMMMGLGLGSVNGFLLGVCFAIFSRSAVAIVTHFLKK